MIWRRCLTVYKNSEIEVLSHIQTDWRIDMADGTITAKQKEILEYIKSEILKRGFPPAVRENLRGSSFKIYFFCTFSFRDIREEWIYQT